MLKEYMDVQVIHIDKSGKVFVFIDLPLAAFFHEKRTN